MKTQNRDVASIRKKLQERLDIFNARCNRERTDEEIQRALTEGREKLSKCKHKRDRIELTTRLEDLERLYPIVKGANLSALCFLIKQEIMARGAMDCFGHMAVVDLAEGLKELADLKARHHSLTHVPSMSDEDVMDLAEAEVADDTRTEFVKAIKNMFRKIQENDIPEPKGHV